MKKVVLVAIGFLFVSCSLLSMSNPKVLNVEREEGFVATCFSSDSSLFAAASCSGSVYVWRVEDWKQVQIIGTLEPVVELLFSLNGEEILIVSHSKTTCWAGLQRFDVKLGFRIDGYFADIRVMDVFKRFHSFLQALVEIYDNKILGKIFLDYLIYRRDSSFGFVLSCNGLKIGEVYLTEGMVIASWDIESLKRNLMKRSVNQGIQMAEDADFDISNLCLTIKRNNIFLWDLDRKFLFKKFNRRSGKLSFFDAWLSCDGSCFVSLSYFIEKGDYFFVKVKDVVTGEVLLRERFFFNGNSTSLSVFHSNNCFGVSVEPENKVVVYNFILQHFLIVQTRINCPKIEFSINGELSAFYGLNNNEIEIWNLLDEQLRFVKEKDEISVSLGKRSIDGLGAGMDELSIGRNCVKQRKCSEEDDVSVVFEDCAL